jgi:alkanesulfonate monooxygenase SsuD/methylene tetrahydromethanopterin reductase-like flavin-dependent oxidoreductase (luciferase family)
LALNKAFPAAGSPPVVAAGAAVAGAVAAASVAGGVACENEVKENVSMKAKLKTIFLEIELWLPIFFI